MTELREAPCSTKECTNTGRWPVLPRGKTYCDSCLRKLVEICGAETIHLGNGPSELFRTRHRDCGAIADVTLKMILKGGWVCQWCKLTKNQILLASYPSVRQRQICTAEQQETIIALAGMRTLLPLIDQRWGDPLSVECLDCGAAQVNSIWGISEGIRLSWLPCNRCNSQRFAVTTARVTARFKELDMQLLSDWTGDRDAQLSAKCVRCETPRFISWTALVSGVSPPCLHCDGRVLDPDLPHRVYLVRFPNLGEFGVFKVGITHSQHDRRLKDHIYAGGYVMETITVSNRPNAFAVERQVLSQYLPEAAVVLPHGALPRGGQTECWSAVAGYPNLQESAATIGITILN